MSTSTLEPREAEDTPEWVRDFPDWITSDTLYEIVDGEYVEKEPVSIEAGDIGYLVCEKIAEHARQDYGRARMEQLIGFPKITQRRRPDVVYVSYDRWAKDRKLPRSNTWPVLPELCIEVINPTDRFAIVKVKMAEYFAAGVSQVWIISPEVELLEIYESMTTSRGYKPGEVVDGSAIIPGFQFNLADVL